MISRRLAALALALLAFAGCHEDPSVVKVEVQPTTQSFAINASGGNASSPAGVDGIGGTGGDFRVTANGNISLGSPSFPPSAPAAPAAPSLTISSEVTPLGSVPRQGSILIAGNVTTAASTPITIHSNNGDIVVSGTLQSGDTGAAQSSINLEAPNGTVYITGTVRTAGSDAAANGRAGGNLVIDAARVVITGTIDTHGVNNTNASGGKGGDVDIKSSQAAIYFTSGSINTSGGSATDTSSAPSVQGGQGGFVQMNAVTATNSVFVFGSLTTSGGEVTGNGTMPTGGQGGNVTIRALGQADLVTTITTSGGAANGTAGDAVGGAGGTLSVNGPATCRFYGSFSAAGGNATIAGTGGTVSGGLGGSFLLGQAVRLDNVEIGQGIYSMTGGTGGRTTGAGGGPGGAVLVESFDGNISMASSITCAGGAATGSGNAGGGQGGSVTIQTDANATGNVSNHTLSIPSFSSLLDTSGGAALGTGAGGPAGTLILRSGGNLTCGARVVASGGSSVSGAGGSATATAPPVGAPPDPPNSAVFLVINAVNQVATGGIFVSGSIETKGGVLSTTGTGGNGAAVSFFVSEGNGSISSSATIVTSGSAGLSGAAGASGDVYMASQTGDVDLSGTMTVSGGASPTTPTVSGNITVQGGGFLTSSATINAVGGASTDSAGLVNGRAGGAVLFNATSATASITLSSNSFILADGGGAPGQNVLTLAGAGGTITLQSRGQPISMSGNLLARGGALNGTGVGGRGGQVVVTSDFLGGGTGGDITLQNGGQIDVSGGTGATGGSAQQNGGDPGLDVDPPTNLAVVFDANNGLGASAGANPGKVLNFGTISANGGSGSIVGLGGDVYFNGLNSAGSAVTFTDGGTQSRTGSVAGGFWTH